MLRLRDGGQCVKKQPAGALGIVPFLDHRRGKRIVGFDPDHNPLPGIMQHGLLGRAVAPEVDVMLDLPRVRDLVLMPGQAHPAQLQGRRPARGPIRRQSLECSVPGLASLQALRAAFGVGVQGVNGPFQDSLKDGDRDRNRGGVWRVSRSRALRAMEGRVVVYMAKGRVEAFDELGLSHARPVVDHLNPQELIDTGQSPVGVALALVLSPD